MTISKAIGSYQDVRDAFDEALQSPMGIRITLENSNQVTRLASRFNMFRKLDRDQSRKIYPPNDPRYNVSPYDVLEVRKVGNDVVIQRPPALSVTIIRIEEETS